MHLLRLFLLFTLIYPIASAADIDLVAVAGRLVSDGHWDRASVVLAEVDPQTTPEKDLAQLYTLRGLVALNQQAWSLAADDLQAAIDAGQSDPLIWLHLARAQSGLGEHAEALVALDRSWEAASALPGAWLLKSQTHVALGDADAALTTLDDGAAAFPDEVLFDRERVMLYIDLHLYQAAGDAGERYLERASEDVDAWLAVAEALRQSGAAMDAVHLLEEARLRFGSNPQVLTLLAAAWLEEGYPGAAARILAEAAEIDPALHVEATECFRQSGDLGLAMMHNALVPDGVAKVRQRLGLLAEQEAWERATSLAPRLGRLGVMDEDPVAYAVAYAWFQSGFPDEAEALLTTIDDSRLFRDATALREAMAQCADGGGWGCP